MFQFYRNYELQYEILKFCNFVYNTKIKLIEIQIVNNIPNEDSIFEYKRNYST
jgi:hypothetical protein